MQAYAGIWLISYVACARNARGAYDEIPKVLDLRALVWKEHRPTRSDAWQPSVDRPQPASSSDGVRTAVTLKTDIPTAPEPLVRLSVIETFRLFRTALDDGSIRQGPTFHAYGQIKRHRNAACRRMPNLGA